MLIFTCMLPSLLTLPTGTIRWPHVDPDVVESGPTLEQHKYYGLRIVPDGLCLQV